MKHLMLNAGKTFNTFLFDMDGVVVDSMPAHAGSWKKIFYEFGLTLEDVDIFKREGMAGLDSIAEIFLEKNSVVPAMHELLMLQERKISLFEKYDVKIFDDIPGILSFLKNSNMKTALVTGSMRRSVDFMLDDRLQSLFDVIVTVDDVVRGKPFPDPYLKALHLLDSNTDDAMVIENAPMGIRAAKSAFLTCVAIETTLSSEYLQEADYIVTSHGQLFSYIQNVCGAPAAS